MPIKVSAQGIDVVVWTEGAPRSCDIEVTDYPNGKLRLFGSVQIRALHWLLGEALARDADPDDRPRK